MVDHHGTIEGKHAPAQGGASIGQGVAAPGCDRFPGRRGHRHGTAAGQPAAGRDDSGCAPRGGCSPWPNHGSVVRRSAQARARPGGARECDVFGDRCFGPGALPAIPLGFPSGGSALPGRRLHLRTTDRRIRGLAVVVVLILERNPGPPAGQGKLCLASRARARYIRLSTSSGSLFHRRFPCRS